MLAPTAQRLLPTLTVVARADTVVAGRRTFVRPTTITSTFAGAAAAVGPATLAAASVASPSTVDRAGLRHDAYVLFRVAGAG